MAECPTTAKEGVRAGLVLQWTHADVPVYLHYLNYLPNQQLDMRTRQGRTYTNTMSVHHPSLTGRSLALRFKFRV